MLYLAIPAQNEVATIGVLLWRLRTVLAEFPREYEVVVYDDASTDETADVAEQYAHAMPVTVLRGAKPVGYAGAVDALVRYVSGHTRYPRRDAMLLLQGDFTDPPGIVPEFARRFEGGADVVVGERTAVVDAPVPVKRLFTAAGWALKPFVRVDGVSDLTGSMRLVRISVLRDALRTAGEAPVCTGDSWTANADLLLRLVPHARRVESVPMEPTYGVRMRETRRITVRDALATLRWGWRARGRRAAPTTAPEAAVDPSARQSRGAPAAGRRREEPEMTAERLRERKKDRDRPRTDSSLEDVAEQARRDKSRRDRRDARAETPTRDTASESARPASAPPRENARNAADTATSAPAREPRVPREERKRERPAAERSPDGASEKSVEHTGRDPRREPRRERAPEPRRPRSAERPVVDIDAPLDDPFAAPAARRSPPAIPTTPTASVERAAASDGSPYADDPATGSADASASAERTAAAETRPPRPPRGRPPVDAEAIDTRDDRDAGDDVGASADDDVTSTEEVADGDESAATRERKRRRNRRSRRRKSRPRSDDVSSGDAGDADAAESADDADGSGRSAPGADVPQRERSTGRAHAPQDSDADTESFEGDGGDDGDGRETGGDGEAQAARAKRRGRRGRRGGARRSRNRGRDDGTGADDAGGGSASSDGGSSATDGD